MEISVNEMITEMLPGIIKATFLLLVTEILSFIIKSYEDVLKKNKENLGYIKILKDDFPLVKTFLDSVKTYTSGSRFLSYAILYIAFWFGLLYEYFFAVIIAEFLTKVASIDIIATFLYISKGEYTITKALNAITLYCTCLNISFFLLFFVCIWWNSSTTLKNFATPLLTKYGHVRLSAFFVYVSYWSFIGITLGAIVFQYFLFYGDLLLLSKFDDAFSLSAMSLNDLLTLLDKHVPYFEYYVVIYVITFLFNVVLISGLYLSSSAFLENLIKSITSYYKCDFPYVKIKTECGDFEGQLSEIRNKSFLVINGKNVLNVIHWDKIGVMEVLQKNNSERYILDNYETDK